MKLIDNIKQSLFGGNRTAAGLNLQCQKCNGIFDCDVGNITFPADSDRPAFEKEIICPKCGVLSMDDIFLTETGQSQLTQAHLSAMD